MTPDERCAQIFTALARLGIRCLIMGGHAVRFYGVQRGTIDFDLAVEDARWAELAVLLSQAEAIGPTVREGPSWRPLDFRRFVSGTLPDGREERVEFWRHNHLLAPFQELVTRSRTGVYGGQALDFLGLEDLLRSKETEREDDWHDIRLLEELNDEERIAAIGEQGRGHVLSGLRSQRGFASALRSGVFGDVEDVERAIDRARHPITAAMLVPFCPRHPQPAHWSEWSGSCVTLVDQHLRHVAAGSVRHTALVEAVRRSWKAARMAADRADKARIAENS